MKNEANEVVMVSCARTPVGKFGGSMKDLTLNGIAAIAASEAIKRAGIDPKQIDEIVQGTGTHACNGNLPARILGMALGMTVESGATNVVQNCASGMRAIDVAAMKLALGQTQIALVVGAEHQSSAPYYMPGAGMRWGHKMGETKALDSLFQDGMFDQTAKMLMGYTAENVAEMYNITREECDEYALMSHARAVKAVDSGRFDVEIIPVEIKKGRGTELYSKDEHPLRDTSLEKMAKLPPVFKKGGVVTAANASGMNDCAGAIVLMTKKKAAELGIKPMLRLLSSVTQGVAPEIMGLGPAVAIPKALAEAGLKYSDVNYWEINEAFAAQVIGCARMLKVNNGIEMDFGTIEKNGNINNNGSGIGLGHPIGATGVRMTITLAYELEKLGETIGGTSMCVGGGPAMANIWTRDI
jgi:acetyl-CoA C-acetyltransferase